MEEFLIRETKDEDLEAILWVQRSTFGSEEEAELVRALLGDPTAKPVFSLAAFHGKEAVGHILFSKVMFDPPLDLMGAILAPLAVVPAHQNTGIGGSLVQEGLRILTAHQVDWVFVLGHASYYPRHGFSPAMAQGFLPPYSIPAEFSSAWMARALTPTCAVSYTGKVVPARTFADPRYWRE